MSVPNPSEQTHEQHSPTGCSADGLADRDGGVRSLGPLSTGRWLIETRGTTHVLDLDVRTYERRPGPASHRFEHDNTVVTLTRIDLWPSRNGRMLIWFDDPLVPDSREHWRLCSRIRSITAAP